MADIKLRYDAALRCYDLARSADGDLVLDEGPRTAAVYAALSWARAKSGDPLPGFTGDLKGHWADRWDSRGRKGSRCWLLNGRLVNDRSLADAKAYLAEALASLVSDGWVTVLDIAVWRQGTTGIAAAVRMPLADGKETTVEFETITG